MRFNLNSTIGAISGVASVVLLSRLLGFARELVIADRFGTSVSYDVYLLAIMLSALVYGVYNFALFYLLVPFISKRLAVEESGKQSDLLWRIGSSITVISLFLSASLALLAPYLLKPWISDLSMIQQQDAVYYARLTSCVVLFGAGEALLRAYLNVKKVYAYPALGYVVFNAVFITMIILFSERCSIGAIAYGWIIGLIAQNALLLILASKFASKFRLHSFLSRSEIRYLTMTGLWLIAIELCGRSYFLIDRYFAIDFGKGIISALNYSQVLIQLPESIVGFAIGAVAFPIMSNFATDKNDTAFAEVYEKTVTVAWLLALPMAVFMFINARPMVEVIFQRGEFDSHSVELTSSVLQPHVFTALALFVIGVSLRACYARNWVRAVLISAICVLSLKYVLTALFSRWFGYVGISAATSISQLLFALALVSIVSHRIKVIRGWILANYLARGLIAGIASGVAGYYTSTLIMKNQMDCSRVDIVIGMLISGLVILAVYLLSAWLLKVHRQFNWDKKSGAQSVS